MALVPIEKLALLEQQKMSIGPRLKNIADIDMQLMRLKNNRSLDKKQKFQRAQQLLLKKRLLQDDYHASDEPAIRIAKPPPLQPKAPPARPQTPQATRPKYTAEELRREMRERIANLGTSSSSSETPKKGATPLLELTPPLTEEPRKPYRSRLRGATKPKQQTGKGLKKSNVKWEPFNPKRNQ